MCVCVYVRVFNVRGERERGGEREGRGKKGDFEGREERKELMMINAEVKITLGKILIVGD